MDISNPILYIASSTSSAGILLFIPANAKSAAISAVEAPAAFLFTQGTSTNPATGSHTRPSIFFNAMANAWAHISASPPIASTIAAAAIALAEPISA